MTLSALYDLFHCTYLKWQMSCDDEKYSKLWLSNCYFFTVSGMQDMKKVAEEWMKCLLLIG